MFLVKTVISSMNKEELDRDKLKKAAEVLRGGGTVAFPTETVYGLGANALDGAAIKKIFQAKGRPSDNPLIVHIGEMSQVHELAAYVSPSAKKLMEAFWPGPITVIVKKGQRIPCEVTAGLDTVGIRMPAHPIALALLKEAKVPVAAPSANTSGKPSPTVADHVIEDLTGRVDMIIDGGNAEVGVESTVIDASGDEAVILRPGAITLEMCREVLGEDQVAMDPGILKESSKDLKPKSPGMKYTHYSPKAHVYVVGGNEEKQIETMKNYILDHPDLKVGIMGTKDILSHIQHDYTIHMGERKELSYMAANLFKALRDFDKMGVDVILAEAVEDREIGFAIMNRLVKAAGHQYL